MFKQTIFCQFIYSSERGNKVQTCEYEVGTHIEPSTLQPPGTSPEIEVTTSA